ncbi:uncharacterized protein LOC143435517 [Arvicanthis niloticus]|uniref:uncharacterized protein LOC143309831 n=1 Tax=Arvicanthis niloticus TaxID=61156 RepID=UPI00402B6AE6
MAKATEKMDKTTPYVKSSTSSAKPKRVKICRCRPQNKRKKSQSGPKCIRKIQKAARKSKNTLSTFPKTKTDEKTAPPTKKAKNAKGNTLLAHYRQMTEELTTTSAEPQPGQSSAESSNNVSSSNQESQ